MGVNDFNRTLLMEDIVKGDDAYFVATGVTDGELLKGVQYKGNIGINSFDCHPWQNHGPVRFIEGQYHMENQ